MKSVDHTQNFLGVFSSLDNTLPYSASNFRIELPPHVLEPWEQYAEHVEFSSAQCYTACPAVIPKNDIADDQTQVPRCCSSS